MSSTTLPAPAAAGLRARKKLATFRALQAAARHLVAERGLDGVTVEEIAAAASVSHRTFFNYFDSKEAAVVDAEPHAAGQLAAALAARPTDEPPLQALQAAVVEALGYLGPGLRELAGIVRANPSLALRESAAFSAFHGAITEWVAARTGLDPACSVYPALLAGQVEVTARLAVARWQPDTGIEGFVALADEIFGLLAGGLAPPVGAGPSR